MPNRPRILVVLVPGLGAGEVDDRLSEWTSAGAEPLLRPAGNRPERLLTDDAFAGAVQAIGVTCDRRSASLRPAWRSDDGVLRLLEQRPGHAGDALHIG